MASTFLTSSRLINGFCDLSKVITSLERVVTAMDRGEDPILEQASIVNRLVCLGFTIAEAGMVISGQKSKTIENLKRFEVISRIVGLPFSLGSEISKADGSFRSFIRIIEQGIIGPFSDLIRVDAQVCGYYEKSFLEMSPEELARTERPIYEVKYTDGSPSLEIVGYKPVDADECRENLRESQKTELQATKVRLMSEMGTAEIVVPALYRALVSFLRIYNQRQGVQAQALNNVALEFDLVRYPQIPVPLHEDDVFNSFVCPITAQPIRDPVRDPTNNRTLYEREAITNWLRINPTSPMTRQPLEIGQLVDAISVKAVIDRRLTHHQRGLLNYLQQHLNDPVSVDDQAIIHQNQ